MQLIKKINCVSYLNVESFKFHDLSINSFPQVVWWTFQSCAHHSLFPVHSCISDPWFLLIVCMDKKHMKPVTLWLSSKTINTAGVKITLATAAAEPTSYKCHESAAVRRNSLLFSDSHCMNPVCSSHTWIKWAATLAQSDYRWMNKCLHSFPVVDLIIESSQ